MLQAFFWTLGGVAILSALLCITRASPVASALWLVVTLFLLAAMYVLLDAHFIAVIEVIVYAGAIMVLFLFVIMLLNLGRGGPSDLKGWVGRLLAAGLGAVLVVELLAVRHLGPAADIVSPGAVARATEQQGAVAVIADSLFRGYLIPFEITSILLTAAVVGAVVLAKRKL